MPHTGTAAEAEARRRLAVQRVDDGWSQREVAAFLGVHPVTVGRWVARFRAGGEAGLAAKPVPGRPRFLTAEQEKQVLGWLADPPTRHGFRTDLWTARRVAELIRAKLGVAFHPHYLREWLSRRGYSPQKPARRAKQQNPSEVARWVREDWPRIQKKSGRTMPTSS
jgi:transposase